MRWMHRWEPCPMDMNTTAQVHPARGIHAFQDLRGCDAHALDNPHALRSLLINACRDAGATVMRTMLQSFDPQGCSVICILAESHASLHTYPEAGVCFVDVFTCGDRCDPVRALDVVATALEHTADTRHILERGVPPA